MPKIDDAPRPAPLARSRQLRGRWGGFGLMRLEQVTPREQHYPTFGIETPYLATPTGFGEWMPVLPGEPMPLDVAVLAGPTHLTFD